MISTIFFKCSCLPPNNVLDTAHTVLYCETNFRLKFLRVLSHILIFIFSHRFNPPVVGGVMAGVGSVSESITTGKSACT